MERSTVVEEVLENGAVQSSVRRYRRTEEWSATLQDIVSGREQHCVGGTVGSTYEKGQRTTDDRSSALEREALSDTGSFERVCSSGAIREGQYERTT
jgi:hypothetical protein